MSPDRWQQVKRAFQAAVEHEPEQRASLLAEACGDDHGLRAEVESLLAAHDADPTFIEMPALAVGPGVSGSERLDALADRTIGAYQLIRPIAVGGMGAVYLAARADDAYRQQVAVKLIRSDRYTDDPQRQQELLRRFRTERQTLANLVHPNIARLLDGGTTSDGVPYLVMDYIEGQPIDQYCDAHKLPIVGRLNLFRTVCSAVQHAHQNLVVHRDLKPGNILVRNDGTPKLLDFGIAKLLDPDPSLSAGLTRTGTQPMTPEYASPEQVRGNAITTSSDVYALGVILYELLTGRRPYRLRDLMPHEMVRIICEQEPEKPSTAITAVEDGPAAEGSSHITLTPQAVSLTRGGPPQQLRRRLTGDLDMIVLKALRKEPLRRYGSVEQLSEDIRRHLDGRPVLARKDTFAYRSAKFVRRHRTGVLAAVAVALALLGGILTTTWQAVLAARERDTANRQRRLAEDNLLRAEQAEQQAAADLETARQVARFLEELFAGADPIGGLDPRQARGSEISVGEILQRGAARITTELSDQPQVQAMLMHTIGKAYRQLGDYDRAAPLLEEALGIRRREYGDASLFVAESLRDVAELLRDRGRLAEAESTFRQALEIERSVLGDEHAWVAASSMQLADVLKERRDYTQAESLYRQALTALRELHGERHARVAVGLVNMAAVLQAAGNLAEAEACQREALSIFQETYGAEHPDVAATLSNMAALRGAGRAFEQAEALYRQAIDMFRRLLPEDHPYIARNLNNLGLLLVEQPDYAAAEPLLRESLALRRRRFGNRHAEVATSLNNLALCLRGMGKLDEAESLLREALDIKRAILSEGHPGLAKEMRNLAHVLFDLDRLEEAGELLREALALQRRTRPADELSIANSLSGLGRVLLRSGQPADAEPLLREALETRERLMPEGHHWAPAHSASVLGECLTALRCYEDAETLLLESYPILKSALGDRHERTRLALQRIIDLYEAWDMPERAAEYRALLPADESD